MTNGIGPRKAGESPKEYAARAVAWIGENAQSIVQRKRHDTAWATKILDRYADGEEVPHLSVTWACEVAGVDEEGFRAEVRRAR